MNIYKPIIIIGAGRSGTTLLTRIFTEHPDIDFRGETSFLVPRLWLELWEDRFWFNWQIYTNSNPRSSCEKFPELPHKVLLDEQRRIGGIIANGVAALLEIDRKSKKVWGFKEIWNGSSHFKYDWAPYDEVFPEAIWLHIIRNPFDFALSCAQWNKDTFDLNYLYNRLSDWLSMIKTSRKRSTKSNYFEVNYEKLVQDAKGVLTPVLNRVDIPWHPDCDEALTKFYLRSESDSRSINQQGNSLTEIETMIRSIEGLSELLNEFDYRIPERVVDHLVKNDQAPADQTAFVNLHDVYKQNITRFHKPQYLLDQLYEQMIQKYYVVEQMNQQFSRDLTHSTAQDQHLLGGQVQDLTGKNRHLAGQVQDLTKESASGGTGSGFDGKESGIE